MQSRDGEGSVRNGVGERPEDPVLVTCADGHVPSAVASESHKSRGREPHVVWVKHTHAGVICAGMISECKETQMNVDGVIFSMGRRLQKGQ
jgi:hypothetical protein